MRYDPLYLDLQNKNNGRTLVIKLPDVGHGGILLSLMYGDLICRPMGLLDETHPRFFSKISSMDKQAAPYTSLDKIFETTVEGPIKKDLEEHIDEQKK